jgi:hypothetical protein
METIWDLANLLFRLSVIDARQMFEVDKEIMKRKRKAKN